MLLYLIGPNGLTLESAATLANLQLFAALFILLLIVSIKVGVSKGGTEFIKSK